jgi:hypothetical protein
LELLAQYRFAEDERSVLVIFETYISQAVLRPALDVQPEDVMEFVFFRTNEMGCALCKNLKVALVLERVPYCDLRNFVGPLIMGRARGYKIGFLNVFSQNGTLCFGNGVLAVKLDRVDDDSYLRFLLRGQAVGACA